jgi:putative ABC transport system substrate-binding protein
MRRREFITLAGTAAVLPFVASAQTKSVPRLGVLLFSNPQSDPQMAAIRRGLTDLGYVEGRNIVIEYRYAEGHLDRLPILAGQLVGLQPTVILAIGGDVSPTAKKVDERIPLVFVSSADPEQLGLVESLRRPGGIATGVTLLQDALASKRLELLKEAAPRISKVAFLWNPDHPDNEQRAAQVAARALGLQLHLVEVRNTNDFDAAFRAADNAGADSLYVVSSRQTVLNIKRRLFNLRRQIEFHWPEDGELGQRKVDFFRMARTPLRWPLAQPTTLTRYLKGRTPLIFLLSSPPSLN